MTAIAAVLPAPRREDHARALAAPSRAPASEGAALLDDLTAVFRRFLVLPAGGPEALTLYSVFSYAIDSFDVAPMLVLMSPVKQCGKTRTLDVLSALVRDPQRATNVTAASLFRLIEQRKPTLLLDEYDAFFSENEQLRGIFNGAHTRDSAFVLRCVGDDHTPRPFSTWCPKILAGLNHLPPTVEDRSIIVPMRRKDRTEVVVRLRLRTIKAELEPLRLRLEAWVAENADALRAADPAPIPGFGDRQSDNWEPLLAIADLAGAEWPRRAREVAQTLSKSLKPYGEQDDGVLLLAHVREVFNDPPGADFIPSETLVAALCRRDDGPWSEYGRDGRGLSALRLSQRLAGFEIRPRKVRAGDRTVRGYDRRAFEDAWSRYLEVQE